MLALVRDDVSEAGGHGEVRDGGDGVDEECDNVESSVAVGDSLGRDGEANEACGHDAEYDPEDGSTEAGDLLRAVVALHTKGRSKK